MKKFKLTIKSNKKLVGTFANPQKAADTMAEVIKDNNANLEPDDEGWMTPFQFDLEEIEARDINEEITDFRTAREYLGAKEKGRIMRANPRHREALIALNELMTIAEAWNKADGFVPDFSNRNQWKYFPWFVYDPESAGFAYAYTSHTPTYSYAYLGSRLCFATSERARQFGTQFIDLWNKVLLF